MSIGNIFTTLLVRPIITILVAIYQLLVSLHIPSPLGFSIIILTIVIRVFLYPFVSFQLRASKKMQAVSPHLSRLKEKHKGDAKRLQEETMKLYKEHGINPAAGCLPMLVQLPIIWSLYGVFQQIVRSGSPKDLLSYINQSVYLPSLRLSHPWDTHFFGLSLGQTPSHLITTIGPFILFVPILTGIFQLLQSKMMIAPQAVTPTQKAAKDQKNDDFATAFQTQSMYMFPLMIAFFSYSFPFGLSLYWNTFTIFGILQQYQIQGIGGLSSWQKVITKVWTNKKQ